ncbi:MAG TPA: hypothetical protein VMX17_04610 [Candidatus Glassbacteria bacterium]|nr:hypothetical protein [Candidatus Glassbacteria bacterium]
MLEEIQNNITSENTINKKQEKIITNFEGLESEFNKFVNSLEEERLNSKTIKGILHVFPSRGKLHELVARSLKLYAMTKKLKYETEFINEEIKKQAKVLIMSWNAIHNQKVSSIRFVPNKDEQSVLVSERKSYSIIKENKLKDITGNNFDKIFECKKRLIVKEDSMQSVLFGVLKATFGESFMQAFFEEEINIKVNHDEFIKFMNDNNVPSNVKQQMNEAVKKHEPSIKYSK